MEYENRGGSSFQCLSLIFHVEYRGGETREIRGCECGVIRDLLTVPVVVLRPLVHDRL